MKPFQTVMTQDLYDGLNTKVSRKLPRELHRNAQRKLLLLVEAGDLNDLWIPPSNRLEALIGNLQGYYSIRINDQWLIIFRWSIQGAYDIEIVDYHLVRN